MRVTGGKRWILCLSGAIAILALGAHLLAPDYFRVLRQVVLRKRCGCPIRMALESIASRTAALRGETISRQASRIVARQGAFDKWHTPAGVFWAPRDDMSLFSILGERAEDPYNLWEWGPALRDAVVLDCGAHLGGFTRQALERGARIVVAIEPGPGQVEALRRTFAAEIGQGRVVVCPKGVWSKDGELWYLQYFGTDSAQVHERATEGAIRVPVTTIDSLVALLNLPRVDFIKLDVEGSEEQAMMGARTVLSRYKPRIAMAAYHYHDASGKLLGVVRQLQPSYRWRKLRCRTADKDIHPLTLLFW